MIRKERQSLINVEHPFGLPIWKPALYKKSRTVTRDAEHALHSDPSSAPEQHILPGNVIWMLVFGWWLALVCFIVSAILVCVPSGGKEYGKLVWGLGWYLFWPFGKYLEGNIEDPTSTDDDDAENGEDEQAQNGDGSRQPTIHEDPQGESEDGSPSGGTIRGPNSPPYTSTGIPFTSTSTITPRTMAHERDSLLSNGVPNDNLDTPAPSHIKRHYGSTPLGTLSKAREKAESHILSTLVYFFLFLALIAPLMLIVTLICWGVVFTIPMAKLNWELLRYMITRPLRIRFRDAPAAVVVPTPPNSEQPEAAAFGTSQAEREETPPTFTLKSQRLRAGQAAPSGSSPQATVLLCTYRAVGSQYYKYTVGGVNIMFVNLFPIVFFVILDDFVLVRIAEHRQHQGLPIHPLLAFLTNRGLIFGLSLASVIPLSYFIGMAVASISAQSSIGMGAVINATFGSIIEIILYSIALVGGKGRLVEGSIVGSLLAGVLLMPGVSMWGGAVRKKEQKFNAKSAGVTSTMLIMAIIGTLTPTLFYQTYGEVSKLHNSSHAFAQSKRNFFPIFLSDIVHLGVRWMPCSITRSSLALPKMLL